ncbi:MAG: hypothetical protein GKR90_07220 [Pseudomonadales bacterium]|nr:hypothetical protein [Pseudomonadales bacterium]
MNWDAIGAAGEIIGAAAVVVSLSYLAIQIRTSNRAVKQAASREIMDEIFNWYGQISNDVTISDLWLRGCAKDSSLTKAEVFQFSVIMQQAVVIWERMSHLEESGEIEQWFLDHVKAARRTMAGSPGFQSWFQASQRDMSDHLRNKLLEEIEASIRQPQLNTVESTTG